MMLRPLLSRLPLAAVAILGLGVGLATAVWTVAEATLLRPLPVADQQELVAVHGAKRDGSMPNFPLLLNDARTLQQSTQSLTRMEFFDWSGSQPVAIRDGGSVFRMQRALVTGGFFDALGARPALGRALTPEDDREGGRPGGGPQP